MKDRSNLQGAPLAPDAASAPHSASAPDSLDSTRAPDSTRTRSPSHARRRLLPVVLLACGSALACGTRAQDDAGWTRDSDRHIVAIGHDVELGKDDRADVVVAVLGSAHVDGDVRESVAAIIGDAHVSGAVGENAVAVLGNAYIDSRVDGNVVAILGNVRLGPQAVVRGQVIEVLGTVERSPKAVIEGGTIGIASGLFGEVAGLHEWIRRCLLYARPLAPDAALGWAWGIALATLAFYLLVAAVFRDGVERCVRTLEAHPGPSVLAALLAILLAPALLLALVITVVGVAVIPFFWLGLFCAGVFGRVVALGWLGHRCLRVIHAGAASTLASVLTGGIVVLALYMVPVLGFLAYAFIGVLGLGAVIYTLVLGAKAARERPASMEARRADAGAGGPQVAAAATAGPASGPVLRGAAPFGAGAASAEGGTPPPGAGEQRGEPTAAVPPQAPMLPRAGFWIRMGALFLDLVLIGFALSLLYHHGFRGTLLVLAAYAAIMWKLRGTTIGGRVFDLQLVRLDGRRLDWETSIVRALACFLSLAIFGLGFLWIAFDPERQAWHDKIAGTVVVRAARGMALV